MNAYLLAKAYQDGYDFAREMPGDVPPPDEEILYWFEDDTQEDDDEGAIVDSWREGYSQGLDSRD